MAINTLWIDDKYVNMLSFQLERFKRVDDNTYNFRCPICGDSQNNKFKARGYIFKNKDKMSFKCHNCGSSLSFSSFLKDINAGLYNEYRLEIFKELRQYDPNKNKVVYEPKIENFVTHRHQEFKPLKELQAISQMGADNIVKKYVLNRKIPNEYHHKIFYTVRFMEWINKHIPNKFNEKQLKMDEPRLVIPFMDETGYVFAVAGRSFKKNSIRYLTIKFDDAHPKIYGLDTINFNSRVYVVEGPIDSMFIDNSLAMAGADVDIKNIVKNDDFTIVFDNEPRNHEIVKRMERHIINGNKVCIWPENIEQKDINDMIISGMSKDEVKTIIDNNTYSGLKAKLKLNYWKK